MKKPLLNCSMEQLNSSSAFALFRLSPMLNLPIYLLAAMFIGTSRSKMVRAVRWQYIRQIVVNYVFIVIVAVAVCPVLVPPIPGYFVMGVLAHFQVNVALPMVLMTLSAISVAFTILQLAKHQVKILSDLRFTRKFELAVKIVLRLFHGSYLLMIITSISILPVLTIQNELDSFRNACFDYFHNPRVLCPQMFVADPRHWKILVTYSTTLLFGAYCSVTGLSSVVTCLLMIYESRHMVSKETLIMQRNFSAALIYQALVYVTFIIVPVGIISSLFYMQVPLPENGVHLLLMVCAQGGVNNLMHIVPRVWKWCRSKAKKSGSVPRNKVKMWSTTGSIIVT
uniref:Uncharacterized protein n=2 Tax=Caenorhabditis japonica TaxID=281687 RepID=A0A8R1HWX9_CAEJA